MKISIGSKFIDEPFGGGNEFIKNLVFRFKQDGHEVLFDLSDKDIDIILLTNPLIDSELSTFNNKHINFYKTFRNQNVISVHRINECDERKNTNYVNNLIIKANKNIDSNIYVSEWIKSLYLEQGIKEKESIVVKGGPLKSVFNSKNKKIWNKKNKLKLVTHHWSSNPMKGIEIYKKIDNLCSDQIWKDKIEFTYIGNLPKNTILKNTNLISPLKPKELASELEKHHIYITASINEPSGNHHMEGVLSGLPVLYINSGALPEYCENFGVEIKDDLEKSINEIINEYDYYFQKVKDYPYTFEYAYGQIIDHFKFLLENRKKIQSARNKQNTLTVFLEYYFDKVYIFIYRKWIIIKKFLGKKKRLIYKNVH